MCRVLPRPHADIVADSDRHPDQDRDSDQDRHSHPNGNSNSYANRHPHRYQDSYGNAYGYGNAYATATRTATATPIPTPVASLQSSSLNFNSQPVGKTNTKNINLNNSGKASLTIANITTSGDFSQTNNCGASLGAGKNRTIAVTFLPTAGGSRAGVLSVSDNANGSPQTASLSGIGTNALKISSNNLSFGTIKVGTTSAPLSVTVTNNQSVSAGLSAVIGGTNPGDFAISPSSTCGAILAAKNSCVYAVTFEPVAKNARNATLPISDSPDPTSPYVVKLSGNGG